MRELRGCVAIVTGASRGIGVEVARALAAEGMRLVLAARAAEELASLAAELRAAGTTAIAVPTDVSRDEDRRALIEAAVGEFGAVDVLVNNAGVMGVSHYHELPPDEIERVIAVNLIAPMRLTQLVIPHMLRQGRGHIVNMTSLSAKSFPPYAEPYVASKAGLLAFTKSVRLEYRARGVSASAMIPGFVREAGMFEDHRRHAPVSVSALIGTTTPAAVARGVVRAIRRDAVEVIVNPQPLRPMSVLGEAFPALALALVDRLGSPLFRKMADARRKRGEG